MNRPMSQSTHMFMAMWKNPMWTNVDVSSRHHWPPVVSGPKFAPQRIRPSTVGSMGEMPEPAIPTKTSTFSASTPDTSQTLGVNASRALA